MLISLCLGLYCLALGGAPLPATSKDYVDALLYLKLETFLVQAVVVVAVAVVVELLVMVDPVAHGT